MKFTPGCDVREQNGMNVQSKCYMTVLMRWDDMQAIQYILLQNMHKVRKHDVV